METVLLVSIAVVAVAVVLLTSLIKNVEWNHRAKNLVATVLSVVGAVAVTFYTGNFDPNDLVASSVAMYGASQLLYNFILRGTAAEDTLALTGNKPHHDL